MKREIKFRGKRVGSNDWIYGFYHYSELYGCHFIKESEKREDGIVEHSTEVQPDTVGQYTGLKDNDGKEIYEGDVVRYTNPFNHNEYTHKVLWDDTWACFGLFNNESKFAKETDWVKIIKVSVLGNAHDNPELIS